MGNPATKPGLLVVLVSGWRKRRVLLGGGRQEQKYSSLSLSLERALSLFPPSPNRVIQRLEYLGCEVAFTFYSTASFSFSTPLLSRVQFFYIFFFLFFLLFLCIFLTFSCVVCIVLLIILYYFLPPFLFCSFHAFLLLFLFSLHYFHFSLFSFYS